MLIKRAIVTGASGPLGTVMIKECISRGIEVLALTRLNSKRLDAVPKDPLVKLVECDLNKMDALNATAFGQYDVCFHFGWMYTARDERNNLERQFENVEATLQAAAFAKRCGCRKMLVAGSQAEYGFMSGKVDENAPLKPTTPYGIAKKAACERLMKFGKAAQLQIDWIRIFAVYGPYENDYILISYVINSLLNGESPRLTACEQKWDYLYTDDAIRAFLLVAEYVETSGIYCLGSGNARPVREFTEEIKKQINPDAEIGYGAIPYSEGQIMHLEADISKLKHDTGFEPEVGIEEGLARTIEWVKKETDGNV